MKKKLLILITICITTIGYSQTFTDANFIEYEVISGTNNVEITDYDYTNGGAIVNIPANVEYNTVTYSVVAIGTYAFQGNVTTGEQITSVIIPNSVISIGNFSFSYNQLTSVTIPNSVTNINFGAFNSNLIANLTIGNSVVSIGNNAFSLNQLASVTIPNSVISIGNLAFAYNTPLICVISESTTPPTIPTGSSDPFLNLRSNIDLSIPSGTASAYAAAQWTGFNSVAEGLTGTFVVDHITYQILPTSNNEVYISDYDTVGGTVVNIPATVVSGCITFTLKFIGVEAFLSKNLTQVTIADGLTEISVRSFKDNQLTNLVIPNSVTTVNVEAFRDNNLNSLTLSDNLTSITARAFLNNSLQSVVLPDGITSVAISAFGSNQLQSIVIPDSVINIDQNAFQNNELQSVSLGSGLTTIGNQAFLQNNLTTLVIPDNVTDFGERAFQSNQLTNVTLGTGDNSIGEDSFRFNQITSVIIPDNVTSIGDDAFSNNQLTSINISENVTSIAHGAFENNQLTSVTIPANVTNIAYRAFNNNPLTDVFSENLTPPNIITGGALDTFATNRGSIHLHIPGSTMGAYVTDAGALWTGFNPVTEDALSVSDFDLVNAVKVVNTKTELKVILSSGAKLESYTIYTITGSKVEKGSENTIAIDALSSGIYILELNINNGKLVKKFAK